MIEIAFLRHGPTAWSVIGRLQGRADLPLSPEGRAGLEGKRLPAPFDTCACLTSPLARARETAALLGRADAVIEPAVIEMDWGGYEGRTVAELRADPALDFAANEARGLDLTPPGGESPRMVQARLRRWLDGLREERLLVVSHKGVIRALAAMATDWPMQGKAPVRFDWRCLQVFRWQDGRLTLAQVNLPLADARRAGA
jgi:broad specificity phosphatase PhoE